MLEPFFYSLYNLIISSDDNINKKSHGVKKKMTGFLQWYVKKY